MKYKKDEPATIVDEEEEAEEQLVVSKKKKGRPTQAAKKPPVPKPSRSKQVAKIEKINILAKKRAQQADASPLSAKSKVYFIFMSPFILQFSTVFGLTHFFRKLNLPVVKHKPLIHLILPRRPKTLFLRKSIMAYSLCSSIILMLIIHTFFYT